MAPVPRGDGTALAPVWHRKARRDGTGATYGPAARDQTWQLTAVEMPLDGLDQTGDNYDWRLSGLIPEDCRVRRSKVFVA